MPDMSVSGTLTILALVFAWGLLWYGWGYLDGIEREKRLRRQFRPTLSIWRSEKGGNWRRLD